MAETKVLVKIDKGSQVYDIGAAAENVTATSGGAATNLQAYINNNNTAVAGKLDKTTDHGKIYGTDAQGAQKLYKATETSESGSVVLRDSNGNIADITSIPNSNIDTLFGSN